MITEEQLAVLLNRSLTASESTNFKLYLKIATQRLEELLCMDVCTEGERTYQSRFGYRSVFVDPFTDINSITIDGEEISEDDYTLRQNDKLNGSWYNTVEFDTKRRGEKILVDAEWGFRSVPSDLKLFLAKLFDQGSKEQPSNSHIKSKKIEDFTVTFKDSATYDEFVLSNSAVINKYSQCNQSLIRHGTIRRYYGLRPV